jgi:hypothetical protein
VVGRRSVGGLRVEGWSGCRMESWWQVGMELVAGGWSDEVWLWTGELVANRWRVGGMEHVAMGWGVGGK